jgi:tRNA dimethylallyltransferase
MFETPACDLGNSRLGSKSDADARGSQHRQVVGAVADGHRLGRREAELSCQSEERLPLGIPGYDRRVDDAGDPTLCELEPVGDHSVKAERRCDRFGEDREPAGDERRCSSAAAHGRNQGARARSQPDPCSCVFEPASLHSPEQGDASFKCRGEVDLAVHGAPSDRRNLWAKPDGLGKLVEHLVLDDRRLQIGDEEPFAPSRRRLNENIDPGAIDQSARHLLDLPRDLPLAGRIEDEIAGLLGGKPDRLAANPQSPGDRRGETGQARPAVEPRDQGEDHLHQPASYSGRRACHKPAPVSGDGAPPVLVIAGPTASGKSALAIELADAFGGTIVNADSLQVYHDLRVLTARPDAAAEQRAVHRLYGFLDAGERGSVADWRSLALAEIAAVTAAGRLPILVGGTGLYIRAIEKGLAPVPEIPEELRREASELYLVLGGAVFRERLGQLDPCGAVRLAPGDRQRLVRAYEVVRATGVPLTTWQRRPHSPSPYRFAMILLAPPRDRLYAVCETRFAGMMAAGALAEAEALAARDLDPDLPAMKAVGLPELLRHLRGEIALADAIAAAQRATRQYAKRQMTWFRHQIAPDLKLNELFSKALLRCARRFVDECVLTG